MLLIKYIAIILTLTVSTLSFGQIPDKAQIDKRVVENLGEQETANIYRNRRDYYEFLTYELNNTCEIMNAGKLPKNVTVSHDNSFVKDDKKQFAIAVQNKELNCKKYNLPQQRNQAVYVRLYDDVILKVNSVMSIKEDFLKTGKQNSK